MCITYVQRYLRQNRIMISFLWIKFMEKLFFSSVLMVSFLNWLFFVALWLVQEGSVCLEL